MSFLTPAVAGTATGAHKGYLAGIIVAILILGYLIYTLIKPEKF